MAPASATGPAARVVPAPAVEVRDGMPFLKVQPGEAVAVRIINDAGHDVASTVTVDGLSMFAFRDDKADKDEHIIVKATDGRRHPRLVPQREEVERLPRRRPAEGSPQARLLKNPARIGAITVTFAAAWEKDATGPPTRMALARPPRSIPGAPIDAPYETVKRQIGGFRAAVTVRYDKP